MAQQCPRSTHEDAQVREVSLQEQGELRHTGVKTGGARPSAGEQHLSEGAKARTGRLGISCPQAVAGGVTEGLLGTMKYTFPW